MLDFLKSIENAHKVPENAGTDSPIPDIFKNPEVQRLVSTTTSSDDGAIQGIAKYDFVFQSARLQIGKEQVDFIGGQPIYENRDDSGRLKTIMDLSLAGRAIINKKTETILKDGTVIVWLEWLEPKGFYRDQAKAKKEGILTTEELLSPDVLTEDSE